MTAFEFVDDDEFTARAGQKNDPLLVEFADALRSNPGKWAKYPRPLAPGAARTYVHNIKNATKYVPVVFRQGGFEATTRLGVLYVRAVF